jgi:hypothetical protein
MEKKVETARMPLNPTSKFINALVPNKIAVKLLLSDGTMVMLMQRITLWL